MVQNLTPDMTYSYLDIVKLYSFHLQYFPIDKMINKHRG
jgi:hypothetical protein